MKKKDNTQPHTYTFSKLAIFFTATQGSGGSQNLTVVADLCTGCTPFLLPNQQHQNTE